MAFFVIEPHNLTSTNEIKSITKTLRPFKAPGLDNIPNILLKKLPDAGYEFLATIFNSCLKIGYFPRLWKKSKIIPILKPGKDPTISSSYRPISLLSTLCKLLEYIIHNRISSFIDENNILINEQFGFRRQHSTVHQIHRIMNYIKTNRSHKKSTGMILIDLERAFDTVWINGLLHKLYSYNCPMFIIKILQSYLKNRQFQVSILNAYSSFFDIPAGVPQGSVLSPILFNLYINDIPKDPNCEIALFADDTAIYTSDELFAPILTKLNIYMSSLLSFFQNWKLKINESKCQAIYFTRCRAPNKIPQAPFIINNNNLPWENEVKNT